MPITQVHIGRTTYTYTVHFTALQCAMTHSFLFVGEYDVSMEGLYHEQCLTESPRALPQYLVWLHGDDGAKGKDERVDVLHVEVVGCHGVRHGVIGQTLRKLDGQY